MHNPEAIQYIVDNRNMLVKFATKHTKNVERAEDVVQNVLVNLHTKHFDIKDVKPFVNQTIVNHTTNLFISEKKYHFPKIPVTSNYTTEFDNITQQSALEKHTLQVELFEFENEMKQRCKEMHIEIDKLPPRQKASVYAKIEGTYSTKNSSQHTNYTIAIKKLRDAFANKE